MSRNIAIGAGAILIASILATAGAAQAAPADAADGSCAAERGETYMAVAANPAAARAGCQVLAEGGTAADAAVAIQASLSVVEPQATGFGGGALITYFDSASGQTRVFDGLAASGAETTDSLATPTDEEKELSGLDLFSDKVNYSSRAVGVPGAVALLEDVHGKFGNTEWSDLFDESIDQAEDGFPLAPYTASLMAADESTPMCSYPDLAELFCDGEEPKAAGTEITNPELADLLKEIRDGGSQAFYDPQGSITPAIVDRLHAGEFDPDGGDGPAVVPSQLTTEDFAAYTPVERDPLCVSVQDLRLCTPPAPSGGGTALLNLLQIAEYKNVTDYDPDSADYAHIMIEASRLAGVDARTYIGDPGSDGEPPAGLASADYAEKRAGLIELDSSIHPVEPGTPEQADIPATGASGQQDETSQIAIVDSYGNTLSMTTTVNSNFGARVLARGLVLNNSSVNFSTAGTPINAMGPDKRPRTTIAPSIAFDSAGDPEIVVGSAGGAPIPDYIAQAVLGIKAYGLSPTDSLAQPHISGQALIEDCDGEPDFASDVEKGTAATDLLKDLRDRGATCARSTKLLSGAGAISLSPDGDLAGAADPRRDGAAYGG
ncbi:MAG: gamma-glutamyltransferase family protein [Brevibacterium sp.]